MYVDFKVSYIIIKDRDIYRHDLVKDIFIKMK